jgi:hypothetical protein
LEIVGKTLTSFVFVVLLHSLTTHVVRAQPLGFSISDGKDKVEIPIEIHNNLVVVPVTLNGALPLKFVVDTGVRTAILTQKSFSDILNLAYSRKYTITGPGGEKMIDAFVTNNVSLDLPGVTGKGHAMLVLERDYLELRNYLGTDVHGILGYELFSRFIVKIDYDKKLMTLYLPQAFKRKNKFDMVPIYIEDTKPYVFVPVVLKDGVTINAKLLVDSGASHALLLDPGSDEKIHIPAEQVSTSIGRGLGGDIRGKAGRVKSITLGSFHLREVVTNFPDVNSYTDTASVKVFRNGTLGGELLSRFTVIYNFPKEQMFLKKNQQYKKPFHYNLSGITVKSKGSQLDVFEVTEVRIGSVAEKAGILKGDLIQAVNGASAGSLRLQNINSVLNSKPGKKIKIDLTRNGTHLKKEIVLVDQI